MSYGFKAKYIAQCIEEIKEELRQDGMNVKAVAVAKLTYVGLVLLPVTGLDITICM